jgi:hypothetical protein
MTQTVDIYINSVKVATAVATNGSATLGTVSDHEPGNGLWGVYAKRSGASSGDSQRGLHDWPGAKITTHTKRPHAPLFHGRVQIQATSGANAIGKTISTIIINDDGSTSLTMRDKWPFAD